MKFSRRTFLKFLAGGAVGALLTPLPWQGLGRLARFTQAGPYPLPAGGAHENRGELRPTISRLCPSRTPVKVRLVNGQAVQTLPWQGHPLAGEGLSALAAAEVQMLYRPSRLQTPLLKQANGAFKAISWSQALQLLRAKVQEAGANLACVCGDENSLGAFLWQDFLQVRGSGDFYLMPSDGQTMRAAASLMHIEAQPGYDLQNSDCALVLGANLLENWGPVLHSRRLFMNAAFASASGTEKPETGKSEAAAGYIFCSALQTSTARAAKQWLPIAPDTEETFLLGLLHLLGKSRQGRWPNSFAPSEQAALQSLLAEYTPEKVEQVCALPSNSLQNVARQLLNAKRPLLVAGTSLGAGGSLALPALLLLGNFWLGNVNQPGGLQLLPDLWAAQKVGDFATFVAELAAPERSMASAAAKTSPQVLFFNECNPFYSLPAWVSTRPKFAGQDVSGQGYAGQTLKENTSAELVRTADVLARVSFKVALSVFANETTAASDLVLPLPAGLERWDQVYSPYGCGEAVYNICPPVMPRQTNSRSMAALLHYLMHGEDLLPDGPAPDQSTGQDPAKTFAELLPLLPAEEQVMRRVCSRLQADYETLRQGEPYVCPLRQNWAGVICRPDLLPVGLCDKKNEKEAENAVSAVLKLLPETRLALSNASLGLSVYANATLASGDYAGSDSVALLNAATVRTFGLRGGSRVYLSALSPSGTGAGTGAALAGSGLAVKLRIDESVPFGAISLQSGYGHEHMDAFSNSKGGNLMQLYALQREANGVASVFAALPVVKRAV